MVKIFQNHFSLCTFTTAILFFVNNVSAGVQTDTTSASVQSNTSVAVAVQKGENEFSCRIEDPFLWCNRGLKGSISHKTYQKMKDTNKESAIRASGENTAIKGKNITIKDAINADIVGERFWQYAIIADHLGEVYIEGGEIDLTKGTGILTREKGQISLKSVNITQKGGLRAQSSKHSENSAFQMSQNGGYIRFETGKVNVTRAHGVSFQGNVGYIDMKDSMVVVEGNRHYALRFFDGQASEADRLNTGLYEKERLYRFFGEGVLFGSLPKTNLLKRGNVHLYASTLKAPESVAIYSEKSGGLIKLLGKSEISGDLLLKAEKDSFLKISADASTLKGGVRLDEGSFAELRLTNGSEWILSQPRYGGVRDSVSVGVSSVSLIHLMGSSISFEKPRANIASDYQTLRIGNGEGEVYKAQGHARLYLNTYLNKGGVLQKQKTDRLLIHGNVSGKTMVRVRAVAGSLGEGTGQYGNNKGISIIQVSGTAEKDSFKLEGDYVALDGSPYQYRLRAYGPQSDLGRADFTQRLVEGEGDFWDFRLENGHIDPHSESSLSSGSRPSGSRLVSDFYSQFGSVTGLDREYHSGVMEKAVVPQVSTYLLLPNSIFHSGLMDLSNQNKQLEILRTTSSGMLETHKSSALFSRAYGGSYHYTSDLSVLEYGYGGDLGYHAIETGVLLHTIENTDNAISLGLMGSYGKLSLEPLDVEQSQESTFDKWTVTAYGSMQHDAGFYIDGLLSYGLFQGDVFTPLRGKTATLKSKPFSASLMGGKTFLTGHKGLVFDPQLQVVYQHLQFDKVRDIDNFDVDMGRLDQWTMRVGGFLRKTLALEKDYDVSFYSKIHLSHSLEEKKSVHFKDAFKLGALGSSLEAGLGFKAKLSQKFTFYGDLVYQHKLSKAGFSGTSFSGGLRYHF
ncbi:autotransporter outer membrane beta-barrel domain-containing protein [Bartonella raoultii]|uniref:Autotransporter outer membrane beta-barrel domain-containing protein n=1 Tax=Bartonella raoultii TaxID=1457020 RepID=A0ABS7I3F8_9HYPH|nr:autotransporter outer membrane beta-barrel domain-containing protein [Bartonella raoultii]MBX4335194.1 autotransporter outer membrane beta-barrel domain-containing protein [Bartonella raoultii]